MIIYGLPHVFFALIFVPPPLVTPGLFQARAQQYAEAWERSVEAVKAIGGTCVEVDYSPFQEARSALDGPRLAWEVAGGIHKQLEIHV